jgi:hypothetical protein
MKKIEMIDLLNEFNRLKVSTRRIHFHIINAFVYTTYTISYNVVLL